MQRREFLKLGATLSAVTLHYQVGAVSHSPKLTRLHSLFHLKLARQTTKIVLNIQQGVSQFTATASTTTWV